MSQKRPAGFFCPFFCPDRPARTGTVRRNVRRARPAAPFSRTGNSFLREQAYYAMV